MDLYLVRRTVPVSLCIVLAGVLAVAGCHKAQHPDEKPAVQDALGVHHLGDVTVSEDRDKGTMTLGGNVQGEDDKQQAQTLAQQAAPDYTIVNEVGVRPPQAPEAGAVASDVDKGIEDNFKAMIKARRALRDQSIDGTAKNGTLVLKGTVKTEAQKEQAEKLAKTVPNVQQVVNEIEVNPKKHSTAQS